MKPLRKNPWTALVLPYEYGPGGAGIGPQTQLRLVRLIDAATRDNYNISRVLLMAGFPPETYKGPRPVYTFAFMMKDWLLRHSAFTNEQIFASTKHQTWSSMAEIREAIRVIERDNLPKNVLVISTWNHAYPRLWLTWSILLAFKRGWNVRFLSTWKCRVGVVHELMGTVKYAFEAALIRLDII